MSKLAKVAYVLALVAIVACAPRAIMVAEVPIPVNFSSEAQHKVESLAHLNNIAVDMADSVLKNYASGGGCISGETCNLSIFVSTPAVKTNFSKAFHSQFVSALVNRGMKVVAQMPAPVRVEIDMQIFKFRGSAHTVSYDEPGYLYTESSDGQPTELVNGVWVIRDLTDTAVHKFGSLTTSAAKIGETNKNKWFMSPQIIPTTEMLITVSFIKGDQYMARASNVYYVSPDKVVYEGGKSNVPDPYKMSVIGDCPNNRCIQ
jgi:hypothetical protein